MTRLTSWYHLELKTILMENCSSCLSFPLTSIMANRSGKIEHLQRKVTDSGKRKSASLVGDEISESGVLDHAVLNRQISEILAGLSENADRTLGPLMEQSLEDFLQALHHGDVPATAKYVCTLLSLELDDLHRAALLSLMVRLAGKRKFDPIAAYILQNQKVVVTGQG